MIGADRAERRVVFRAEAPPLPPTCRQLGGSAGNPVWADVPAKEVSSVAVTKQEKVCSQCGTELKHDILEKDWFCPECDPVRAAKVEKEAEEEV